MGSRPEDDPATYFGFRDLHGFKDYIVWVMGGAPDVFMKYDWLSPDEQMNLDRAFVGLRYGIELTLQEKGDSPLLTKGRSLVEEAHALFRAGQDHAGDRKLQELSAIINKIPSR
jgi:hypothetical protein